jgi:hypothetical protein
LDKDELFEYIAIIGNVYEVGYSFNELNYLSSLTDQDDFLFGVNEKIYLDNFWNAYSRTLERFKYFSGVLIKNEIRKYLNSLENLVRHDSSIEFGKGVRLSADEILNQIQNLKSLRNALKEIEDYYSNWQKFSEQYKDERLRTILVEDTFGKREVFVDVSRSVVWLNPAKVTFTESVFPFPEKSFCIIYEGITNFGSFLGNLWRYDNNWKLSKSRFQFILEDLDRIHRGQMDDKKRRLIMDSISGHFAKL